MPSLRIDLLCVGRGAKLYSLDYLLASIWWTDANNKMYDNDALSYEWYRTNYNQY